MSLPFMQRLVARDLAAAEAEIGAIVPVDLPDTLDNFLQFRIADLSRRSGGPAVARPGDRPDRGRTARAGSIGSCGFHAPPGPDGRVEVGYRVEPAYRRQGVATEVVRALFDWAHAQGVDRFRASVSPDNVGLAGDHPRPRLPRRSASRSTTSTARSSSSSSMAGRPPA